MSVEIFCVKCRKKVGVEKAKLKEQTLKNKRKALVGNCPICGIRIFKITGKA
ncbi:MAG: DUF5679 domain-containing protein [Candidatus Nezhaarchaeales archaeon]